MKIDELKILLALNGNQRIEHLEAEIFANKKITTVYLHSLCKDFPWYKPTDSNANLADTYALYILNARWPLAERVIVSDPSRWEYYKKDYDIWE